MARRVEFSLSMIQMIKNEEINPDLIIFSDKAQFWLNDYVNKQNFSSNEIDLQFFENNVTNESYQLFSEQIWSCLPIHQMSIDVIYFCTNFNRAHIKNIYHQVVYFERIFTIFKISVYAIFTCFLTYIFQSYSKTNYCFIF